MLPCILVELIVLTPVLIAFRKYKWTWLNGRLVCSIGFLTGAILSVAVLGMLGWNDKPMDSVWLVFGAGFVGLANAFVFRLLAVRTGAAS